MIFGSDKVRKTDDNNNTDNDTEKHGGTETTDTSIKTTNDIEIIFVDDDHGHNVGSESIITPEDDAYVAQSSTIHVNPKFNIVRTQSECSTTDETNANQ